VAIEHELALPPFPASLFYIWNIYHRLRRRKGGNGFGVSPCEWPDIAAFAALTGTRLAPWEVGLIERLDDAFIAAQNTDNTDTDREAGPEE